MTHEHRPTTVRKSAALRESRRRREQSPTCANCGMYLDLKGTANGVRVGCACKTIDVSGWPVERAQKPREGDRDE